MRTIRVLAPGLPVFGGGFQLPTGAATHVARVLRLVAGDVLVLFDGAGQEAAATITEIRGTSVHVSAAAPVVVERESPLRLTLVQGVSRGERMDLVMQKATELGVARLVPVMTERSVVKLDAAQAAKRLQHWQGVVAAACEQSGRAWLPEVLPPQPLLKWLAQPAAADESRFLLHPGSTTRARDLPALRSATLLIGPEGGLSPQEREAALQSGFQDLSLGPRILRTETAALAALAALQAVAGDL
jgi:16S rRNA (uracil1498-N3)-methyltransferase